MATAATEAPTWHVTSAEDAAERLEVDVCGGLSAADAARRLERDGPIRLAEATKERAGGRSCGSSRTCLSSSC